MRDLFTLTSPLIRRIDDEGFGHGSQNGEADNALLQIDSHFNEQKAKTANNSVERTKTLEAQVEHLTKRLPEIDCRWQEVRDRLGPHPPAVVFPVVLVIAAVLALAAEAIMLAPSLDVIGVATPVAQIVFAFGLGITSTVAFHYFLDTLHREYRASLKLFIRCAATGLFVGLIFFGIARGEQTAFSAQLADNPHAQFLFGHPLLMSIVFVFLTLAFPVAAALASTNGIESIRNWHQFTETQRDNLTVPKRLSTANKQLQAEKEKLEHALKALDEQRKKWRHDYLVHHERGRLIGAKQMALWMVWLRAFTAAFIVLCMTWWLQPFSIFIVTAVFLLAWIYFYYERVHPSPTQLHAHANINFRATDNLPTSATPLGQLFTPSPEQVAGDSK